MFNWVMSIFKEKRTYIKDKVVGDKWKQGEDFNKYKDYIL